MTVHNEGATRCVAMLYIHNRVNGALFKIRVHITDTTLNAYRVLGLFDPYIVPVGCDIK